jgi:transcriptional regulator
MLIHPWDASVDSEEWRSWLATSEKFGQLIIPNLDPLLAPLSLPTHFTILGDEILLHFAKPNQAWKHIAAAKQVRLSVIGDYAYIPSNWRTKPGFETNGVPTSYYAAVQFVATPTIIDDASEKAFVLNEQMKDIQPELAPTVADNDDAYGRMLSGIRGLKLAIIEVEAKFKYDDHNSNELRERVSANLEARNSGADRVAARQQRRRLGVIGDWAKFREK